MRVPNILMREPPNFSKIAAVFPVMNKSGVLFAYGDFIYNPSCAEIPTFLAAHENTHLQRQRKMGPEAWWDRYLTEMEFRYQEEFAAHVTECSVRAATMGRNRVARRKSLILTSLRLANNELYRWDPKLSASVEKNKLRDYLEKMAESREREDA